MKAKTHCKIEYAKKFIKGNFESEWKEEVIVEYSVNGKPYEITFLPRPAKNTADLMCVYYRGIRYASLAKCLKFLNTL